MLNLDQTQPFDIESPEEVPGWGQSPGNIIQDAVTEARYCYHTGGAAYALQERGAGLRHMIEQKTWRSQDAADLLAFLERQVFVERSLISNNYLENVTLELERV